MRYKPRLRYLMIRVTAAHPVRLQANTHGQSAVQAEGLTPPVISLAADAVVLLKTGSYPIQCHVIDTRTTSDSNYPYIMTLYYHAYNVMSDIVSLLGSNF